MLGNYDFSVLSGILFVASVAALIAASVLWRRRESPGARYLSYLELSVSVWSFAYAWEMAARTVALKTLWSQIEYVGVTVAPLLFFLFATAYSGRYRWHSRRNRTLLFIMPTITFILTATTHWNDWHWTQITIDPATNIAIFGHGPWFWVFSAYQYLLLMAGVATLLATALRMSSFYRPQVWAILFGSSLPIIGNMMYLTGINPIPGMDWTPVAIMLAGVVIAWGVYRHRLFDLAPIARGTLVDTMSDGVMVIDSQQRVGDMNAAMASLIGASQRDAVGKSVRDLLPDIHSIVDASSDEVNTLMEYCLKDGEDERYFDLRISPLINRHGKASTHIIVLRDITQRKHLEGERSQLIGELRETLREVQTLSGLLPICANCKSIRDDQGYWHSVEAYLGDRSEAEFSSGICPDCMQKLRPDAGQTNE